MTDDTPTINELEEKIAAARSGHMDSAAEKFREQLAEEGSRKLSLLKKKYRDSDASLIQAKAENQFARLTDRLEDSDAGLRVDGTRVSVADRSVDTSSNGTGTGEGGPAAIDRPMFRREGGT